MFESGFASFFHVGNISSFYFYPASPVSTFFHTFLLVLTISTRF